MGIARWATAQSRSFPFPRLQARELLTASTRDRLGFGGGLVFFLKIIQSQRTGITKRKARSGEVPGVTALQLASARALADDPAEPPCSAPSQEPSRFVVSRQSPPSQERLSGGSAAPAEQRGRASGAPWAQTPAGRG